MGVQITPIPSNASLPTAINTLNNIIRSLAAEAQTKTTKQSNGTSIISGKLSNGLYGDLFYDSNGIDRLFIGQDIDGEVVIAKTKKGKSVLGSL